MDTGLPSIILSLREKRKKEKAQRQMLLGEMAEKTNMKTFKRKHQAERVDAQRQLQIHIDNDSKTNTEVQNENSAKKEEHLHLEKKLKKVLTVYQRKSREMHLN
ncbi:MAG: hypothetical protein AB2693_34000 [Candidatus Thiodiazotropha sp.]